LALSSLPKEYDISGRANSFNFSQSPSNYSFMVTKHVHKSHILHICQVLCNNHKSQCYCCYPLLGSHKTNEKIKKIYQKIFERNPKNNRSEKRMLECRQKAKIG